MINNQTCTPISDRIQSVLSNPINPLENLYRRHYGTQKECNHPFFVVDRARDPGCCLPGTAAGWDRRAAPALAAQPVAPEDNVVTIGVQAALTLGNATIGVRQANAVQLAVDQVNAAGGIDIGGTLYTVELAVADSACKPEQADDAANALLAAGAVAVVGDTCSSASFVAQSIFDAADVSMVSASSTSPQLTDRGLDTTFRVITRDDTWPIRAAEALYNTYALQSVAITRWRALTISPPSMLSSMPLKSR